jgi:hypothetical protein
VGLKGKGVPQGFDAGAGTGRRQRRKGKDEKETKKD